MCVFNIDNNYLIEEAYGTRGSGGDKP